MRRLPKRPDLPQSISIKLKGAAKAIAQHSDPRSEAKRRYANARKAKWFDVVVKALQQVAGPGQRCMFCNGNEASDVEHYRPKDVFPHDAMTWENFLWSCSVCNRHKGSRFPPATEPGELILNPMVEDPWEFFFLDKFGLLTPLYDLNTGMQNQRALSTRDILKLNRDALQECRFQRLRDLKKQASELIEQFRSEKKTMAEIATEVDDLLRHPFQADVADYCLRGPGTTDEPFKSLLEIIAE